jgi:hypothetical protein
MNTNSNILIAGRWVTAHTESEVKFPPKSKSINLRDFWLYSHYKQNTTHISLTSLAASTWLITRWNAQQHRRQNDNRSLIPAMLTYIILALPLVYWRSTTFILALITNNGTLKPRGVLCFIITIFWSTIKYTRYWHFHMLVTDGWLYTGLDIFLLIWSRLQTSKFLWQVFINSLILITARRYLVSVLTCFCILLQNINLPPDRASLHVKFSHFYILYWNFCDIKLFYMVMGYLNYYNDLCELLPVLVCSFFKRMCNILHLFSSPIF